MSVIAEDMDRKALENRAKWGSQDYETLGLAIAEEAGELAQAILQYRHERASEIRIAEEALDLGALCIQVTLLWHEIMVAKTLDAAEQAEATIGAKKRTIETLVGELRVARKLHAKKCDQHMEEHTARIEAEAELAEFMAATDDLRAFLKPDDVVTVRTPGKRGSVAFAMGRFIELNTRLAERSTP